jgi:hypothetical protein
MHTAKLDGRHQRHDLRVRLSGIPVAAVAGG